MTPSKYDNAKTIGRAKGGVRMRDFKLYNEDCAEGLKKIDSDSIDLVVTSPPYDNLRTYNGYSFDFERIAQELFRVVKSGGVVVWVVSDGVENGSETGTSFKQALYFKEIGFNLHDTMIWKKETCAFPEETRYYQNFEYMFVFSKGKPKTINLIEDRKNLWSGARIHGTYRHKDGQSVRRSDKWRESVTKDYGVRFNVWEVITEKNNRTGHPAVFPNKLAHDHIITWSNRGEIVLDPFSGSGTTAIEALNNGRQFIGFEISKDYYAKSIQRIKDETAQMNIFDFIGEKSN